MEKHGGCSEITLAEAARRLHKSWGQAWRLLLQGKLDGRKVGNHWIVTTRSVERFGTRMEPHSDNGN